MADEPRIPLTSEELKTTPWVYDTGVDAPVAATQDDINEIREFMIAFAELHILIREISKQRAMSSKERLAWVRGMRKALVSFLDLADA